MYQFWLIQLALKIHTDFGRATSLATLDKLVDRFSLPTVVLPIGDTSLTHVMRLAAHSTTSPTPTAMGQSFIILFKFLGCGPLLFVKSLSKVITGNFPGVKILGYWLP
jgi:hypothetical protein